MMRCIGLEFFLGEKGKEALSFKIIILKLIYNQIICFILIYFIIIILMKEDYVVEYLRI